MKVPHVQQKEIWEKEHTIPYVLPQMDVYEPSSGVVKFLPWVREHIFAAPIRGLEMGCGKGRNSIWLAQQGIKMAGFDFSQTAITEAIKRSDEAEALEEVTFISHDATSPWPFDSNYFDFAIDCFASTDIESSEGRSFARDEFKRVLKPGGFLLVYTLSTDDGFHKEMVLKYPAQEKNSFIHPTTGKFEKIFDHQELLNFYKDFKVIEDQRLEKTASFFDKEYNCKHFWLVLQKI